MTANGEPLQGLFEEPFAAQPDLSPNNVSGEEVRLKFLHDMSEESHTLSVTFDFVTAGFNSCVRCRGSKPCGYSYLKHSCRLLSKLLDETIILRQSALDYEKKLFFFTSAHPEFLGERDKVTLKRESLVNYTAINHVYQCISACKYIMTALFEISQDEASYSKYAVLCRNAGKNPCFLSFYAALKEPICDKETEYSFALQHISTIMSIFSQEQYNLILSVLHGLLNIVREGKYPHLSQVFLSLSELSDLNGEEGFWALLSFRLTLYQGRDVYICSEDYILRQTLSFECVESLLHKDDYDVGEGVFDD